MLMQKRVYYYASWIADRLTITSKKVFKVKIQNFGLLGLKDFSIAEIKVKTINSNLLLFINHPQISFQSLKFAQY